MSSLSLSATDPDRHHQEVPQRPRPGHLQPDRQHRPGLRGQVPQLPITSTPPHPPPHLQGGHQAVRGPAAPRGHRPDARLLAAGDLQSPPCRPALLLPAGAGQGRPRLPPGQQHRGPADGGGQALPCPRILRYTALHSMGCTALHCTSLYFTLLHCTSLHCSLYCTIHQNIVLHHCTALCVVHFTNHYTTLHYTALHCTALHSLHLTALATCRTDREEASLPGPHSAPRL